MLILTIRRGLWAVLLVCGLVGGSAALNAKWFSGVVPAAVGSQTIVSVGPSSSTFTGDSGSANSLVANMTATMDTGVFSGTWSLSGANAGQFKINATTGALTVCNTAPSCTDLAAGSYSVNAIATQSGAVGSPFTQAVAITGIAPGAAVVTETFTNSGPAMVAGDPIVLGQALRRGDVPAGNCVRPRNAATHANLIYQLDEVSTRIQNSDDGSLRHMAYSVQWDSSLANGATAQIEWVLTGAACPTGTQKQALSAFTAAHPNFQVVFTDVRNQDGSVRDSGIMRFNISAAVSNTGRDAPEKYATGSVRDGWKVKGAPIYDTSGNKDPLIYVVCFLDLFTNPSDQTSLGRVRWVCRVDSPWVQVAAGTAGISGAPGPAGFANDPQGIFYRQEIFEGGTSRLDWSRLDKSVTAASNPANTTTGEWTIPGTNMLTDDGQSWYQSIPVCATSTGSLPGNFSSLTACGVGGTGKLFFATPDLPAFNTNKVIFTATPYALYAKYVPIDTVNDPSNTLGSFGAPTNQGTGTHTFSHRTYHPKFQSWWTVDLDGLENWLDGGSNQKRPVYPAWTSGEKLYWEQTGVVPPIDLSQTPDPAFLDHSGYVSYGTNPISNGPIKGGGSGGSSPYVGILNEWDSQALILSTPQAWARSRSAALGVYPHRFILNEATGRVPVYNNGPPVGPGGNGVGGNYISIGMGTPMPHAFFQSNEGSRNAEFANPLENTPYPYSFYTGGFYGSGHGWSNDHLPNFVDLQYAAFGSRHLLDTIYFDGARSQSQNFPDFNSDGFRDNTINGNHYWVTTYVSVEWRFGAWGYREILKCARYGANANPEAVVCNDYVKENSNYWAVYQAWKDGSGSTGYTDGPFMPGSVPDFEGSGFMYFYLASSAYMGCANLRDPLSCNVMATHAPRYVVAVGGDVAGSMCSFYSLNTIYQTQTTLKFPGHAFRGPNVGPYFDNTTLAYHNTGNFTLWFQSGSPDISLISSTYEPLIANGDTYLNINYGGTLGSVEGSITFGGPDQLATQGQLYVISNVNKSVSPATFRLICPVGTTPNATCPTPGAPFTGYTFGGNPYSDFSNVIGHIQFKTCPATVANQYDGGEGGYSIYTSSIASLAKILGNGSVSFLGRTLNDAYNTYFNVRGIVGAPRETALKMNGNVVVP